MAVLTLMACVLGVAGLWFAIHRFSWPNRALRTKFSARNKMARRDVEPDATGTIRR